LNTFIFHLTHEKRHGTILNVFNISAKPRFTVPSQPQAQPSEKLTKSEATQERILDTAIGLFRQTGFDETTMRDIASEAGVALGLAYHYFPSKEALVMAYYERVQREHRLITQERLKHASSLRERLAMLLQTKFDILKDDRKLLGALFRYTGSPTHPLSFLGKTTALLRADCMNLFAEALEPERLPEDLRELLPLAMWALHMGLLLYFLYDSSPNLKRTRKLVDGSVDLVVSFLKLAKFPLLRPVRRSVMGLLRGADLIAQE
jgi:AcrR family transcriptional regulator